METKKSPPGWDEQRARKALEHYETQTGIACQTIMEIRTKYWLQTKEGTSVWLSI